MTARIFSPKTGEPWRARTSDPLIKSAIIGTPAGYGSYDLLTFVTGCSRQRVYLLSAINAYFWEFWSQVGHKPILRSLDLRARLANIPSTKGYSLH